MLNECITIAIEMNKEQGISNIVFFPSLFKILFIIHSLGVTEYNLRDRPEFPLLGGQGVKFPIFAAGRSYTTSSC